MNNNKKRVCLALQGGGAYGAFTWGILDKFLDDGRFEIDAISATSSGSVNAVILAEGFYKGGNNGARESLHDVWRAISDLGETYSPIRENPLETLLGLDYTEQCTFNLFDLFTRMFSPYLLNPTNFNPLRDMLIQKIDFHKINHESKIKLFLCATNVKTGRMKLFEKPNISIDAMMSSACLPELYQAVEINGEFYWDGGFLGNPAIFPLIYNSKDDDIVIIHTNPFERVTLPNSSTEIANRINEVTFNSSLIRELRAIAFVTKLLDKAYIKEEFREEIRRKYFHIVKSDSIMNQFTLLNKYKWTWSALTELRDLGRKIAEYWIRDHFNHIGKKSTLNFNEFL